MIYEPKILYNPKSEPVEFMSRGQLFIFKPREKKHMEGFDAYHALTEVNTGLVEFTGQEAAPGVGTPYAEMPWKELVSLGSKEGVFQPGMGKEALIQALEGLDAGKEGAIQEPASEEEE